MYKYFWHLKYKYIKLIEPHWKPGLWVIHIQIQQLALTNTALAARTNTQTYCNKYTKHITPQIRILPYTILSWSLVRHVQILVIHMYKYRKHVKPRIGFLPNTLSPCPWVSCMYKYLRRYTCLIAQQNHSRSKVLCVPYPQPIFHQYLQFLLLTQKVLWLTTIPC